MYKSRKGVSLFTVLLFMLVATIAGTATYKWLSSEGQSSADRMLMNEARAASLAGVNAARAWMIHNPNDVGSLLKQYFTIDEGKKKNTPVSLTEQLKPMAKRGQMFTVTLVGVDAPTNSATYKLKIVSTGYARDRAASYTETAVLNVAGLYRVLKPTAVIDYHIDFHYAYFGGSTSFAGGHGVNAALINGNWGGNPIDLTDDFVVTGNITLNGSKINVGGTTCVGGNLYPQNGIWTGSLFVGGEAGARYGINYVGEVREDAYFSGNIAVGTQSNPGFKVGGNMFLGGSLYPQLNSFPHTIGGNLCLGQHGALQIDPATSKEFSVAHNVWMPVSYENGVQYGLNTNKGINGFYKRKFGSSNNDTIYIKDGAQCPYSGIESNSNACLETVGNPPNTETYRKYFQVKGGDKNNGYSGFTTKGILETNLPSNPPFSCGASVKTYCDSIWKPKSEAGKSCDNSPYYVSDMLMTGWRKFMPYADTATKSGVAACRDLKKVSNETTKNMNTCWQTLYNDKEKRKQYLFNDYLVIKMTYDFNASSGVNDAAAPSLRGKFLFIYENQVVGSQIRFPRTDRDARVFVYFERGSTAKIDCENDKGTRNYFFFTQQDIQGFLGKCTWAGSVYATASSCAKIPDINGSVTLTYDPNVVDDMAQSGIICDINLADTASCGEPIKAQSSSSTTAMSSSVAFGEDEFDGDFVANGSQLYVSVESEYKSMDKITEMKSLQPTLLVEPRIVYLTKDSPGRLSDYVSVVRRTGADSLSGKPTLSCMGLAAGLENNKVADKVKNLFPNVYNCSAKLRSLESNFYVVVLEGSSAKMPLVYFEGEANEFFEVGQTGSGDVKLVVTPTETDGEFAVTIGRSDKPTGWTIKNKDDDTPLEWKQAEDGSWYAEIIKPFVKAGKTYDLLKIEVTADALPGTVYFTLRNPQGCIIAGGTAIKAFNRRGSATIHRGSLSQYCRKYPAECPFGSDLQIAADSIEDCTSSAEWVYPGGVGCEPTTENEEWKCDAGVSSMNKIAFQEGSGYDRSECVLYNPENHNSILAPKDDASNPGGYTLYASLKKRHHKLHVDMKNSAHSEVLVEIADAADTDFVDAVTKICHVSDTCDYLINAGKRVRLIPDVNGSDVFSRWDSDGAYFTNEEKAAAQLEFVMAQNRSYTAIFNEKDEHCFYTEFDNVDIWCTDNIINCIDYCNGSAPCSKEDGHYSNAAWIVVNSDGGSTAKPEVFSKNYLRRAGDGKISMVMSTVEAGPEGNFNIQVMTGIAASAKQNKVFLNSGLIVRSNKSATEYISVNFFGLNENGKNTPAVSTHARVCYMNKVQLYASDVTGAHCKTVELLETSVGVPFSWQSKTPLNFDVTVDGDSLHIIGSFAGSASVAEVKGDVDLRMIVNQEDYSLNDADHGYVGLKLGDADFGVNNASWHSKQYGDQCFADPSIYCSFAARYMSGEVPQDESVKPIVGFSNWFLTQGKTCLDKVTFYYNGCDMPSSRFAKIEGSELFSSQYCNGNIGADGLVEKDLTAPGLELKKNQDYLFQYEGRHGFKHSTRKGFVRNASVSVNCTGVNAHIYRASCGAFYVGQTHSCTQDELLSDASLNHGTDEYEIPLSDGSSPGKNLRDAKVLFYLTMDPGVRVSVKFIDDSDSPSDVVNLQESGMNVVENKDFANRYGFDPEHVKKIILKAGSGIYSVDSIVSQCAASLKVRCGENDAIYNSAGQWRVRASVDPLAIARKCKVEPVDNSSGTTYWGLCNELGEYIVDDPDFMDKLNGGSTPRKQSFKVSVYSEVDAQMTSEPESECIAISQEYRPVDLRCHLEGTNNSFVQGSGVPAVVVEAENCPEGGCVYDITLSNGTEYVHNSNIEGLLTWQPNVNTTKKLHPGSYSYTVNIYNADKTVRYKTCTTSSFDVIEAIPASASSCEVTSEGHFRAFVTSGNTGPVTAILTRTDLLGNALDQQSVPANSSDYVDFDLQLANYVNGTYQFNLSLNGDTACAVTHTVNNAEPLTVECQTPITNQAPGDPIILDVTVSGCSGSYNWNVPGATASGSGTNTSGSVSFYDINGTGDKSYTFKVDCQSSGGQSVSGECTFHVEFSSAAGIPVTFSYQGPATDFVAGKTYQVSCPRGGLICTAPAGGTKIYINNTLVYTTQDWQGDQYPGGFQQVEYCSNLNGATVTVSGTMKCKNDW